MENEIVNDKRLDAAKDKIRPPRMTEVSADIVEHLLEKLGLSYDEFFSEIKSNGEYLKDKGKIFFWTSDVAKFIKSNL